MKIPKEIIDYGLDLETIKDYHSKTKLGKFDFDSIQFVKRNESSILIRLNVVVPHKSQADRFTSRQIVIEISRRKIREKLLNKLLN